MEDLFIKRLNLITLNDLDMINYYKSNIKITHQDIINVWTHYIEKSYFYDNSFNIDNEITKSCLRISLFENTFSLLLEEIFVRHNSSLNDELLLFYIKDTDTILLLYKSYYPLKNNKIQLPFRSYYLKSNTLTNKINSFFETNENICVMVYSLSPHISIGFDSCI